MVMERDFNALNVEEVNGCFQRDIAAFKKFLRTYPGRRGRPRSEGAIRNYLRVIRRLAGWLEEKGIRDFRDVDADMLEEFVLNWRSRRIIYWPKPRVVKEGPPSWRTKNLVITVLCLFYKWLLGDGKTYPPCVEKIRMLYEKRSLDERSRIRSPDELLSDEELLALLRAAEGGRNELVVKRDKAFIALLYESGARIGEIIKLKNKDVAPTEYGFKIWVEGKTGRRAIPIIDSKKYLFEWGNTHPYGDDPEAPLFIKTRWGKPTREPLTLAGAHCLVKRLAERAKLKKRVFPHLLRHSRASELAGVVTEAYLKKIMGWSMSSNMPSIYVHLGGVDVEREILKARGILPERQLKSVLESRICPACGFENDPHFTYCARCGRPLKSSVTVLRELSEAHEAMERMKRLEEEMKSFREFVLSLLSGGRHPLETRDLLNFYETAKRARGRLVELKVEATT